MSSCPSDPSVSSEIRNPCSIILIPGVDGAVHRAIVVGMRDDVGAVVFRNANDRLHLFLRELRTTWSGIEFARDPAAGHDLEVRGSAPEVAARSTASLCHPINDVHHLGAFQRILFLRFVRPGTQVRVPAGL